MIQINLLPVSDIKRRAKAKKEIFDAGYIWLLSLFVLFCVAGYLSYQLDLQKTTLEEKKAEKKEYDVRLAEIDKLEKEKELLVARIGVINKLKQTSYVTVHVMDEVANLTPPDRMWLTDVSQNNSQVQISGMSLDNQTVAKYMVDLEGSNYLNNLVLIKSNLKQYADHDLKEFTVTSSITLPEAVVDKQDIKANSK